MVLHSESLHAIDPGGMYGKPLQLTVADAAETVSIDVTFLVLEESDLERVGGGMTDRGDT